MVGGVLPLIRLNGNLVDFFPLSARLFILGFSESWTLLQSTASKNTFFPLSIFSKFSFKELRFKVHTQEITTSKLEPRLVRIKTSGAFLLTRCSEKITPPNPGTRVDKRRWGTRNL